MLRTLDIQLAVFSSMREGDHIDQLFAPVFVGLQFFPLLLALASEMTGRMPGKMEAFWLLAPVGVLLAILYARVRKPRIQQLSSLLPRPTSIRTRLMIVGSLWLAMIGTGLLAKSSLVLSVLYLLLLLNLPWSKWVLTTRAP